MRLVIFGSRDVHPTYQQVVDAIRRSGFEPTEIVCGMARGADTAGLLYAARCGIPVAKFPADWDKHGRRAGYLRNEEMARYADAGLAFWDGASRGTAHMIRTLRGLGKAVHHEALTAAE